MTQVEISATRLCDLATKLLTKLAKNLDFLGYLEKQHYLVETSVASFGTTLEILDCF